MKELREDRSSMSQFRFQDFLMWLMVISCFYSSPVLSSRQAAQVKKWKELSAVTDTKQFIYEHVDSRPPSGATHSSNGPNIFNDDASGFNHEAVAIVAALVTKPAGCLPQEQVVEIPANSDPSITHWPPCTRLSQCGGCCFSDVHECIAIKTEPVTIHVIKVVQPDWDSGKLGYKDVENITLTKHLECDCRCRTQAHHCNPVKQDYNEQSCSCRCRNENEATSCPSQKRWDDKECACVCQSIILNCLDDEFFSYSSCSCQEMGTPEELQTAPPQTEVAASPAASDPCARARPYTLVQNVQ